ncbi:Os02g0180450 [Oryza sativa Japonica Group]|uniref:Os02g0180450 protein n=1 Tax=Oryza sativa subsp. japonica TaxID=39947 RepID=A0A0P0VFJ9_ORYSJ|nr:Os02g0180450 [Oryza sativa Japonica Group]
MSPPFFSDQQRPWQRRRSKLGSHRGCRSSLRKTPPPERSPEGGEESSDATGNAKPSIQVRFPSSLLQDFTSRRGDFSHVVFSCDSMGGLPALV